MGYHADLLERYSAVRGRLWDAPLRRQRQADKLRERRLALRETRVRLLTYRQEHLFDWLFFRANVKPRLTVREIVVNVCAQHDVSVDDFMSRRRTAELVAARHEAFYLARFHTDKSLPEIGRRMGGFDHTSVLHGIKKHCKRHGLDFPRKREAT